MCGSRNFGQFYLVLSLFYSLKRGANGFIAEKTILILYKGSRGGPLFSGGGGGGGGVQLFPGCPDLRNLIIYEQDCLRNVKYQHSEIVFICVLFKRRKQNLLLCKTGGRVVH